MSKNLFLSICLGICSLPAMAQNPIVQTMYTADPAPLVHNDVLYLYTSHDEDASTWFVMNDWKLYTTTDMVNWTDHGAVSPTRRSVGQRETLGPCNVWKEMGNSMRTYP